ncbi:MAG: AtpZ/AtpI family protein [Chitinophagales bacterium]
MPDKKEPSKDFLKYSGLAFQMGATIAIGIALGIFLDNKFDTGKMFTTVCSLLFVVAGIYLGIKDLIKPPEK